jgi:hypothetical protein
MTRNKRLKQQFIVFMVMIPLMVYMQLLGSLAQESFLIKGFWFWMIFILPASLAPNSFAINASFIEKQLSMPLSVFEFLQAKYRFFSISSLIFFVLFLPSLFLGIKIMELIATLLFAVGFTYFVLFCSALFSYKPLDIKASSFYNYQGIDAGNFLLPLVVILIALAFSVLSFWLFGENVTLIAMSIIGLFFIATHKIWLKHIATKFEATKYKRLEKFRE